MNTTWTPTGTDQIGALVIVAALLLWAAWSLAAGLARASRHELPRRTCPYCQKRLVDPGPLGRDIACEFCIPDQEVP